MGREGYYMHFLRNGLLGVDVNTLTDKVHLHVYLYLYLHMHLHLQLQKHMNWMALR